MRNFHFVKPYTRHRAGKESLKEIWRPVDHTGETKIGVSIKKVVCGLFWGFLVGCFYLLGFVGFFSPLIRISRVMKLVAIF